MRRAALRVFRRLPRRVRRLLVRAYAPSYTVGAVLALFRTDGSLLLVEQRHSPGWALPGGLLRAGEGPAAGVVREVAEEVGLDIDPARLPLPHAVVTPYARRVDVVYVARAGEGALDARITDELEVTGIGWFPLDALPEVGEPTLEILSGVRLL